jgi:hypothetical protein
MLNMPKSRTKSKLTRRSGLLGIAPISLFLILSGIGISQQKEKKQYTPAPPSDLPEVIWRDPGDVSSLNLIYGIGGKEDAPDPDATYTFVEEDMNGTSPKFRVKDANGVEWKVKMGAEPQAETAATRLLWAAGYFVDEDYYAPEIKVAGLPKLRRGEQFVSDGAVHGVRLERKIKGQKNVGTWDWFKNPFLNTREFNGLRVMMSLLNNWDLKTINNSVYEIDGQRRYVVSDVGATFGKTGDPAKRSKSDVEGYEKSKFIEKIHADYVDFTMHSRPLFIAAIDAPNYEERSRMEKVTQHIPRADAKWLGQKLAQLSDEQIRDCFRSAGYMTQEVDEYTKTVKERIAELNAL